MFGNSTGYFFRIFWAWYGNNILFYQIKELTKSFIFTSFYLPLFMLKFEITFHHIFKFLPNLCIGYLNLVEMLLTPAANNLFT